VQALIDPKNRASLLKESAALFAPMPEAYRKLNYVQEWHKRLETAARSSPDSPR
jgi:hypothetical protein